MASPPIYNLRTTLADGTREFRAYVAMSVAAAAFELARFDNDVAGAVLERVDHLGRVNRLRSFERKPTCPSGEST